MPVPAIATGPMCSWNMNLYTRSFCKRWSGQLSGQARRGSVWWWVFFLSESAIDFCGRLGTPCCRMSSWQICSSHCNLVGEAIASDALTPFCVPGEPSRHFWCCAQCWWCYAFNRRMHIGRPSTSEESEIQRTELKLWIIWHQDFFVLEVLGTSGCSTWWQLSFPCEPCTVPFIVTWALWQLIHTIPCRLLGFSCPWSPLRNWLLFWFVLNACRFPGRFGLWANWTSTLSWSHLHPFCPSWPSACVLGCDPLSTPTTMPALSFLRQWMEWSALVSLLIWKSAGQSCVWQRSSWCGSCCLPSTRQNLPKPISWRRPKFNGPASMVWWCYAWFLPRLWRSRLALHGGL